MKVSFDCDDTILNWRKKSVNPEVFERLKEHKAKGDEVILVTRRFACYRPQTLATLRRIGVHDYFEAFYFTDNDWKADTLNRLKVDLHYDDDWQEKNRVIKKKYATRVKLVCDGEISDDDILYALDDKVILCAE